jgi:hypothetical protein
MATTAIADFKQFFKDMNDPNKGLAEASATLLETADKQSQKFGSEFKEGVLKALNQMSDKLSNDKSETEKGGKTLIDKLLGNDRTPNINTGKLSTFNALMGKSDPINLGSKSFPKNTPGDGITTTTTTKTTVDVGGKIQVEFTTPNGSELTKKMLDDWANSPQTKQYFMSLSAPQNPTKAPNNTNYGN